MARTRLYRGGVLEREGFPVAEVSDLIADETATVWVDFDQPTEDDLAQLAEELSLHPLAVEDAVHEHQRPKLDRYESHLFVAAYAVAVFEEDGFHDVTTTEVCAFLTRRAFVTVRKGEGFPVASMTDRWDAKVELTAAGPAFLLWGFLDTVVDSHFVAAAGFDDDVEALEDAVLADRPDISQVQRGSLRLRKGIMRLRRVATPMRELVGQLARHDSPLLAGELTPYFADVYDHVLRVSDWTESLRELVGTITETNLTNQSNRLNLVMKKVTSWAAIIAVPTLITGYYGQNLDFPLLNTVAGWWLSSATIVACSVGLYALFKRHDWL